MSHQSPRKTTKIRRSAQQWQAIMESFAASGLTQEAFCARESLAKSTFSKWRNRLTTDTGTASDTPMFVDLASLTSGEPSRGWDIELSLGDGMSLRLRQS